ncbi:unnamed protein product [Adineta ricciae]|uniref:G-protein coupled receptors family 1 profile domain-containing protein n=1 Tax=Adineta ricciae TaxID=249248 RepID=A0A815GFY5_ADIRI|nr:unnamed protein product [Adineta ricciae]CAF1339316.1 unnamed protein product [Adineta ricciae]
MSFSAVNYLNYISKQINIYVGTFVYIFGNINNILCFIIFLSTKRLTKNASSIYLIAVSIANLVILNTSFLSRVILPTNFNLDPVLISSTWCKLRQYFGHVSATFSLFCTSWAMIDQYLLTSKNIYFRQFSTPKNAYYVILSTLMFSILHSTPLIIYNQLNISSLTNITSCSLSSNMIYQNYVAYFVLPFILGFIPGIITIIFTILTYSNINSLHRQEMRTQIQQQLTKMVIGQNILFLIDNIAYTGQNIYTLLTVSKSKADSYLAYENIGLTIINIFGYAGYTFSFIIYIVVSSSIRKHFKELIKKFLNYLMCHQ